MSMRRCWSFGATVKTLMKVSAGTPESMVVIADSIDVPTRCAFPRRAPRKEGLSLGAPMNWRQKSVGIWAARGRAISILGAGVLLQPNDDPIHNGLPEPRDGEHAVALVAGGLVRARRHQVAGRMSASPSAARRPSSPGRPSGRPALAVA